MNTKKIVISIIAVVAVLSTALALGTIDFDSKKSANTVKAEISTVKSIESMQIQKSEKQSLKLFSVTGKTQHQNKKARFKHL